MDALGPVLSELQSSGLKRGDFLAVARNETAVALCNGSQSWLLNSPTPVEVLQAIEAACSPRWVLWSSRVDSALPVQKVARSWNLAAVHRLLRGGWNDDPSRIWAATNALPESGIPKLGQLDFFRSPQNSIFDALNSPTNNLVGYSAELAHEIARGEAVQPDGYLRPEWVIDNPLPTSRLQTWARLAFWVARWQTAELARRDRPTVAIATARSESAAELLCTELTRGGLPFDQETAEAIIAKHVGPRPASLADELSERGRRDHEVLTKFPEGTRVDLRNPVDLRAAIGRIGFDVPDTRAARLEPFRDQHPAIAALLRWRKAERIATTYGYAWIDENVSNRRLRGQWSGSDGAAGRMTATAGLHNMPSDLRPAVTPDSGFTFVHADLGQIEPRILAAVSGDRALALATQSDDLYAPVAATLGVDRPTAKLAVLGAMYGATSGVAGNALRGMERSYPVAMRYLDAADRSGQQGQSIRTYGGRHVSMAGGTDPSRSAAFGRYARNALVQGAAAEFFKAWVVTLRSLLHVHTISSEIVLCLHDEILVHVAQPEATAVARMLEESLHSASARWMPGSTVRYIANASITSSWSKSA